MGRKGPKRKKTHGGSGGHGGPADPKVMTKEDLIVLGRLFEAGGKEAALLEQTVPGTSRKLCPSDHRYLMATFDFDVAVPDEGGSRGGEVARRRSGLAQPGLPGG